MQNNVGITIAISFFVFSITYKVFGEPATDTTRSLAEEARQKGLHAYTVGKYVEAADAFSEAYRLKSTWKLLFNIGQSNAAAKRYGMALEAFEKYLVDGGDDVPSERAKEVRQEIESLKSKIGYITLKASRGAKIYIDNVERGKSPLAGPLAVNAAQEQKARAVYEDGRIVEKRFRVPSGQTAEIDLSPDERQLERVVASQPVVSEQSEDLQKEPQIDKKGRLLRIAGFSSLGLGGAMLVAGAITGGLSLGKHSELKKECTDNICYSDNYKEMDKMNNLASTGTGLLVAGGVAAAAGLGIIVFQKVAAKDTESISLNLSPIQNGLIISGRF